MRRTLATAAVALTAAAVFTPLAAAQQEPTLKLPAKVSNGGVVTVMTGPCKTFSTVTSPGLKGPITLEPMPGDPDRLHGSGPAVAESGTYTASLQCDSKTLTTTFDVGALPIAWSLGPAEIEPGGTIYLQTNIYNGGCFPKSPLTSPGFAAPMKVVGGNMGRITGDTTVITTPGTYEVVLQCSDRPESDVKTFRILGDPPTSTTPPPPGKPKPPIVKPKGAPDTGGGGTA
ncbi:hypothetical protein ABZ345_21645 [Lentzea sp. NPDC005914]|uniref:hypothetical protein n=1 Tax=Lentzea sp. NPDC005914 TaxID=3154572 RepID=UPI0033FC2A4B